MALPEDHLAKFDKMADAEEMWEAINSRFGGNDESKKLQKYLLKQQKVFLCLPQKVYIKGTTASSSSNTQNVALCLLTTLAALMIAPQLDCDDLEHINDDDLEEMDLKWQGKSVDTKFDKPYVVRQPNAQRIRKPSVLGKPTPFSYSLDKRYFPKTRSVPKTNVSEGLSKPITAQTLPQTTKKAVLNLVKIVAKSDLHNDSSIRLRFCRKKEKTLRFGFCVLPVAIWFCDLVMRFASRHVAFCFKARCVLLQSSLRFASRHAVFCFKTSYVLSQDSCDLSHGVIAFCLLLKTLSAIWQELLEYMDVHNNDASESSKPSWGKMCTSGTPKGEALRKCILSGPYKPTTVLVHAVKATDNSSAVHEHTTVETPLNMSPKNKAHFLAKKEAIHLILTGIRDDIYSIVDACQTAQEMWEAIERLQQDQHSISLTTLAEMVERDKDMEKNLALIAKYFKKIYKPTNNNLRTSSNSKNKNVDTTLGYKNDDHSGQFGTQRTVNIAGTREKECRKPKRVKDFVYHKEKMLLCKQAEQGVPLYMAKIQEVPNADLVSNTCLVEMDDSNVTPNSPDMCEDDIQNDQNDEESDDERVALANLIANLKLDTKQTEFEKYKAFNDRTVDYDKLKHKLNEALGQLAHKDTVIREGLKTKVFELSTVKEKHDELMKQSLLPKSHYEGLVKQKTKVITDMKLREEHDIEKMLSMEKQLTFLNEIVYKRSQSIQTIHMMAPKVSTYNARPTFSNPRYLKQAQSKILCLYVFPYDQNTYANRLIPDREETLALKRESRSKLNKDSVRPYDYNKLYSLYVIFKPLTQEYETQLAHANEIRRKMWRKYFVKSKPNIYKNVGFLPVSKSISKSRQAYNVMTNNINHFKQIIDDVWVKHSKDLFRAPTAQDMEILIQTCLMPLAIKSQGDSLKFVHEKDVMCSYLQSLSDLDALVELQCMYLHKVKECECLAQKLSKQTEYVNKKVQTKLLQHFVKLEQHSISLEIALQKCKEQTSVVRQPNAQRISKPSVLGKPTPFSDSLKRRYFPKTRSVPRTNVSEGPSKPVTALTLPQTAKKAVRVNHKPNVSRPQLKNNHSRDKVLPNNSQVKAKETQVEVHLWIPSDSNKMKSVIACKDSLNSKTLNANIVQLILFIVDSGCTKHMTSNLKLLCNFVEKFLGTVRFGNDQFALILGYRDLVQGNVTINRVYYVEGLNHNLFSVGQFYDADFEVAFRKSTCFVRDLHGNDLLIGNSGSGLYTISLQESTSSTPLCLMSKATPTQAWLWHQRLSHLNFDYINLLSKKDIMIGLPKLKYVKDQLCSSCEVSKAKRSSFKSKTVPSSNGRLNLLHMDLCGPMQVASINRKKYILMKEKGDQCILVGNSTQSKGYQVYNKRTRMIVESIHIRFDEIKEVSETSAANNTSGLVPQRQKASDYDNPDPSTSAPSTHTNMHAEENNNDQIEEGGQLQDDEFTNPFGAPAQEEEESSSHNIGNSSVLTFNQPPVSEYRWTKDHPLEQVCGNPSRLVQTRRQLATDPEMCMFTLT
nr:retrovirus-related Pol polyprotein from transposon TNT 1-94 [Tanacetum cinerariifolium]